MGKKEQQLSYIKNLLTAVKVFFLKYRKILLYIVVVLPLVISILAYFAINKGEDSERDSIGYSNTELNEGINQYRYENYERARMLLEKASADSHRKKIDSRAFFYLGNIEYKRGNYSGAINYFEESLTYDRKNVFTLFNSAQAYMKIGDPESTLKNVKKIYELQKEYPPNLLLFGNIRYAGGKYEKALSKYEDHENMDSMFKFNAAAAHLKLGNPEEAGKLLNLVIEDPNSEESLKGLSYFILSKVSEKDDTGRTVRHLRGALNVFQSSPDLRYNLALLLLRQKNSQDRQKNYQESVELLRSVDRTLMEEDIDTLFGIALFRNENLIEALELYLNVYKLTDDTSAAHIIGDIYVKLGELQAAEKYYKIALEKPGNEGAFRNLVNIYIKEEKYSEAEDLCEKIKRGDPTGPMPYLSLADVYFNTDRSPEGRGQVEEAVLLAEEDVRYLSIAAKLYQENGLNNNALQLYHRILSIESGYYKPYIEIAEIFLETGHIDKANKILTNAKNVVDDTGQSYRLSLLQAEMENGQKVFDLYEELTHEFPYRYEAYFNLALKYIEDGRYENAVQTVEKCLESEITENKSALSDLHAILGVARHYMGNVREATKAYKKSLELDENNEYSFLNLKVLD